MVTPWRASVVGAPASERHKDITARHTLFCSLGSGVWASAISALAASRHAPTTIGDMGSPPIDVGASLIFFALPCGLRKAFARTCCLTRPPFHAPLITTAQGFSIRRRARSPCADKSCAGSRPRLRSHHCGRHALAGRCLTCRGALTRARRCPRWGARAVAGRGVGHGRRSLRGLPVAETSVQSAVGTRARREARLGGAQG